MVEFTAAELYAILTWGSDAEYKALKTMGYTSESYKITKSLWDKVYQAYSETLEREAR